MRNGVLIEESSPQDLLAKENTNSLEEAFLSLSRRQQYGTVGVPIVKLYYNAIQITYAKKRSEQKIVIHLVTREY